MIKFCIKYAALYMGLIIAMSSVQAEMPVLENNHYCLSDDYLAIKKDKEIALNYFLNGGTKIDLFPPQLQADKEVYFAYLTHKRLDNPNISMRELVLKALKIHPESFWEYKRIERLYLDDEALVVAVLKANQEKVNAIFESLSDRLKNNRNVVLSAIKQDGLALLNAPARFKSDKQVVLNAVRQNGNIIDHVDPKLQHDPDIILAALTQSQFPYPKALSYATDALKSDRQKMLMAVRSDGRTYAYLDESLKKDHEIILTALKNKAGIALLDNPLISNKHIVLQALDPASLVVGSSAAAKKPILDFQDVNTQFKKDKQIQLAAILGSSTAMPEGDDDFRDNKTLVLLAFKQLGHTGGGTFLEHASQRLKNDDDVVLAAILDRGFALKFASSRLRKDKQMVMLAVSNEGGALHYADKSLQDDRDIVMAAVLSDGRALAYASPRLQKDKRIVMLAVADHFYALKHAYKTLQDDEDVVFQALKNTHNPTRLTQTHHRYGTPTFDIDTPYEYDDRPYDRPALSYASKRFRNDKSLVLKAVRISPIQLYNVSDKLKKDRDVVIQAVQTDGSSLAYADISLRIDADIIKEALKTAPEAIEAAMDGEEIAAIKNCSLEK